MSQVTKSRDSVTDHLVGIAAKFFLSVLFGLLVSWLIFDFGLEIAGLNRPIGTFWLVLLRATPLVWGVLGVLYFDKMLDLARRAFEACFRDYE